MSFGFFNSKQVYMTTFLPMMENYEAHISMGGHTFFSSNLNYFTNSVNSSIIFSGSEPPL